MSTAVPRVVTICLITKILPWKGSLGKHLLLALRTKNPCKGYRVSYGGGKEDDETLVRCVKREVSSESGIEIFQPMKCAFIRFHDMTTATEEKILDCHVYLPEEWRGEPQVIDPSVIDPQWFPVDELPENIPLADKEWIPRVLAGELLKGEVWYKPGTFSEYERSPIWESISAFHQ